MVKNPIFQSFRMLYISHLAKQRFNCQVRYNYCVESVVSKHNYISIYCVFLSIFCSYLRYHFGLKFDINIFLICC